MDIDRFWELNADLPPETAAEVLAERLSELQPDDIASYQAHFDELFASAYQWSLWGAAYIMDGGCSDDGFTDFRYGLISRGRTVFESALASPDSLAECIDDEFIPNESFGYVANKVYREKTGNPIPRSKLKRPSDPLGESWDFDDAALCQEHLPKLWERFGA